MKGREVCGEERRGDWALDGELDVLGKRDEEGVLRVRCCDVL